MEDKIKSIDKFKQYKYNDKDITKIVEEKKRFRRAPVNYAMSKTELLSEIVRIFSSIWFSLKFQRFILFLKNKNKAIAKEENDVEREEDLKKKLGEMEERANALDRKRTENISIMA